MALSAVKSARSPRMAATSMTSRRARNSLMPTARMTASPISSSGSPSASRVPIHLLTGASNHSPAISRQSCRCLARANSSAVCLMVMAAVSFIVVPP